MFAYENREEVQARLAGTTFVYDGKVVYCAEVRNGRAGPECYLTTFTTDNQGRMRQDEVGWCPIKDGKYNINEIRLGYVNLGKNAYYLTRMPVRRYKQSLCNENVHIPRLSEEDMRNGLLFENIARHKGFSDCIFNIYPSFQEVMEMFAKNKEKESIAFSRSMAVQRDPVGLFKLQYKGRNIAWGEASKFVLPTEFYYLRETINEHGIEVA